MSGKLVSLFVVLAAGSLSAQQPSRTPANPEKLGVVHFSTSCTPSVAARFDRAMALLHSFEFGDAIATFEQILATDPACGMAHWGIALSRWGNPMAAGNRSPALLEKGRASVEAARRASANSSARERDYIEAAGKLYQDFERVPQSKRVSDYSQAMEKLSAAWPADTEARIFYAISLVASASPTDKTYANQLKAGSILEPLWAKEPSHPGLAHYLIHTYDYPALARRGAAAAREYSTIAPSAAHALHMPSHIFTRTGSWRQSIETNLRSMRIAEKNGSIAEALHAADYAEYAYLQLGLDSLAAGIVQRLPSLESRFDVNAVTGAAPGSAGVFALAAIPARYALEREDWKRAAALVPNASGFPWTEAITYFARALGAVHTGDFPAAQRSIDSLTAIRDRLATRDEKYWSEQVAIQALGAEAWLDLDRGSGDSALALMREAAAREDATEKNAVTPGPIAPARELLGDMLMRLDRPAEALSEYQATLVKEPNRRRTLAQGIRAANAAGNRAAADALRKQFDALGQTGAESQH